MRIYTRCGDDGTTSLPDGERVMKNDVRVECLGCLDELSAHIGLLVTMVNDVETERFLQEIQHILFVIGCAVSPKDSDSIAERIIENTKSLDNAIDRMSIDVPTMTGFVLAGSNQSSAQAHVCRTVCRRAERAFVSFDDSSSAVSESRKYLNRLSDYFFIVARRLEGGNESERGTSGRI